MSKKQEFISFVNELMSAAGITAENMPEGAKQYWVAFSENSEKDDKPLFTDNGKLMLNFLQNHMDTPNWKARDIAEELFISSRTVSGSMRKLISDGFVEKVGQEPTVYALTEKGKNIVIDEEN